MKTAKRQVLVEGGTSVELGMFSPGNTLFLRGKVKKMNPVGGKAADQLTRRRKQAMTHHFFLFKKNGIGQIGRYNMECYTCLIPIFSEDI